MNDQDAIDQREWESPGNWAGGVVYRSRRDSRLMVPKRPLRWGPFRQSGTTLNFAHRRSLWVLLGLLSVPLGFLLLSVLYALFK